MVKQHFRLYVRTDGSSFIVGTFRPGIFIIIGEVGHYKTRREAVEVGHTMAGALVATNDDEPDDDDDNTCPVCGRNLPDHDHQTCDGGWHPADDPRHLTSDRIGFSVSS